MENWDFQDNSGALWPTKQEMYPSSAPLAKTLAHNPGAAAQATKTVAARAGYRHVCVGIYASIAAGATPQTPISVNLIDGASGGTTLLWTETVSAPANQSQVIQISGIAIPGTQGNALTLEFSAASVANALEAITLAYIDIKDA